MQVLTRAWSALVKSVGMGTIQTAYSLYFMYKRRMAVLRALKSRKDDFLPLSQRESFHCVEGPVSSEAKYDKAVWERPGHADHAMHLLPLEFFQYLHGLLGSNMWYALENNKRLEWSAVEQFFHGSSAAACVWYYWR